MRSTSKGKTKRRSLGTCRFDLAKCAISSSGSEASGVALALELVAPTGGEKKYGVVPPGVIRLVVSSEFVEGGDGDTTLQSDDGTYSDSDSLAAYPEDFISKDEDSRPSSLANATAEVSSVEPEDVDSIQAEIDKLQREIEAFESPAKISAADQPADASIPPRVEDSKRRTRAALLGGLRSGALEAAVASLPPDDPPAAAAAATAAARGSGSGSGSDRAPRGWQTASHETATGSNAPSRPANAARSPRDGADSSAPTRSPSAAGVPSTARKTRAALLGGLRSGALEKAVATLPENGEGGSNSGARAAAVAAATARPARVATAVDDGELGLGSLSRADAVPTGESQVARELAAAQRELADMKAAMQSLRSLLGPGRGGGSPRDDDAVRDQLLGATQQLCECRVELSQAHERQADLEAELREAKLLLAQVPPPPFFFFFLVIVPAPKCGSLPPLPPPPPRRRLLLLCVGRGCFGWALPHGARRLPFTQLYGACLACLAGGCIAVGDGAAGAQGQATAGEAKVAAAAHGVCAPTASCLAHPQPGWPNSLLAVAMNESLPTIDG